MLVRLQNGTIVNTEHIVMICESSTNIYVDRNVLKKTEYLIVMSNDAEITVDKLPALLVVVNDDVMIESVDDDKKYIVLDDELVEMK